MRFTAVAILSLSAFAAAAPVTEDLAARADCACGPSEVPLQDNTGAVACMTHDTGALRLLPCSVGQKRAELAARDNCACGPSEVPLQDNTGAVACMTHDTGALRLLTCSVNQKKREEEKEEELSARDCSCNSDEGALRDYNGRITCMNKKTGATRGLSCE